MAAVRTPRERRPRLPDEPPGLAVSSDDINDAADFQSPRAPRRKKSKQSQPLAESCILCCGSGSTTVEGRLLTIEYALPHDPHDGSRSFPFRGSHRAVVHSECLRWTSDLTSEGRSVTPSPTGRIEISTRDMATLIKLRDVRTFAAVESY